ncbi:MAG: hypothetical protein IJK09_00135 [Prevotella sp.]|nr:hypothetical protein [Prevotella sp.]MBQ7442202.1 hypothetical protein [Prevotella sp.]MBQ9222546.1 hypothetical protein [Prevotella sp.]MBR0523343.1 hypothetical protein [Prevotella sp.]
MKRMTNLMVMVLLAMLSMTIVSCEEDDESVAYNLEGTWVGSVKSEYFDRRYGYTTEWTDVQLEFYKDPYLYAEGSGREVDYNGRYYSSVTGFNYSVRNHVIYIDYYDGTHIAIYNYRLWMNEFYGEFHDYYTGEYIASFQFERLDYGWNYGYNKLKENLTDQVIKLDE